MFHAVRYLMDIGSLEMDEEAKDIYQLRN